MLGELFGNMMHRPIAGQAGLVGRSWDGKDLLGRTGGQGQSGNENTRRDSKEFHTKKAVAGPG